MKMLLESWGKKGAEHGCLMVIPRAALYILALPILLVTELIGWWYERDIYCRCKPIGGGLPAWRNGHCIVCGLPVRMTNENR